MNIGHKRWVIADGYIPLASTETSQKLISRDVMCILDRDVQDAHILVMLIFSVRESVGPYRFIVNASRTEHVRFIELTDPESVPHNTDYASIIESDVPIVEQHTRLDSHRALALMTTMTYPA